MYNKTKSYAFVGLVILGMSILIAPGCDEVKQRASDPYEPNNSFGQASKIALGDVLAGGLVEQGDRDIFQFSVESAGTVIYFNGDSSLTQALSLTFYGSDTTNPIASNNEYSRIFPRQRLFAVTEMEGTHYLVVRAKTDTVAKSQRFLQMAASSAWGGVLGSCSSCSPTPSSPVVDPLNDNPSGTVKIKSISASRINVMGQHIIRVEITFENQSVALIPGSAIRIGSTTDLDGWVQINQDANFSTGHHDPVFGLFDSQIISFVPVPCTGVLAGVEYRVDLHPLDSASKITLKITDGASPSSAWLPMQIPVNVGGVMGNGVLTFDIPEPPGANISGNAFFLAILGSHNEILSTASNKVDFLPNDCQGTL